MTLFTDVKNLFTDCHTPQDRYQKIIELGKGLSPMDDKHKTKENIVSGCQSIVYLHTEMREEKMFFTATSDALISAGLAALLIKAYSGLAPELVLKSQPIFLEELDLFTSLSPSRSNGLSSMLLRMQQDTLKFLVNI